MGTRSGGGSGSGGRNVNVAAAEVAGAPGVLVTVRASVPPLGLWGPGLDLEVTGSAVEEVAP